MYKNLAYFYLIVSWRSFYILPITFSRPIIILYESYGVAAPKLSQVFNVGPFLDPPELFKFKW